MNEIETKPICRFYKTIYKRMVVWFGFTFPFWLSDMPQETVLKSILNMNIAKNMYLIFINVAIKIKKNNDRPVELLEEYKRTHPNVDKLKQRQVYYNDNLERIREYNKMYNMFRQSRINIFKKSSL